MGYMQQHVIIVGGGFGGIRTALDLSKKDGFKITLISKNTDFEYYPGLHKMVRPKYWVPSIPLKTLFEGTQVSVIHDTVISIDAHQRHVATSQETFTGDFLVLALGSQTEYFGIPGLAETAYGFKSLVEAKKLREHLELLFSKYTPDHKTEAVVGLHIVVAGAGPNGVDLAGELAVFTRSLAQAHQVPESLVTLDLVESGPRVLGMMSESVSRRVEKRLRALGVHVLCNRDLRQDESWTITTADMTIGARTLVWTAGIVAHELVTRVSGFQLGKKNRVQVDRHLQPYCTSDHTTVFKNVFCIGDIADTPYAGLAQTALADGAYVAKIITQECTGKSTKDYAPRPVAYNIGVGPRWSVLVIGNVALFGIIPAVLRTLIDIKFFLSIMSPRQVWRFYTKKHL